MSTWLIQQEDHIKAAGQIESMPTVMETAQASAAIREDLHREFLRSQKRRSLVEQFWHSVIDNNEPPSMNGGPK